MKFGKKLLRVRSKSNPEWAPFWVNYKLLKKKIKDIEELNGLSEAGGLRGRTISSGSVSSDESGPSSLAGAPPDSTRDGLTKSAGEVAFFKVLTSEFKKASIFFSSVQEQLEIRTGRIVEGLRHLGLDGYVSKETTARNLLNACVAVYKELIMLENYAIMTHTAFSKILKKHDKRTHHNTRLQFMRNRVNSQPFATYPKLKQMLEEMEHTFHQVNALQPAPICANTAATSRLQSKPEVLEVHGINQEAKKDKTIEFKDEGAPSGLKPDPHDALSIENAVPAVEAKDPRSALDSAAVGSGLKRDLGHVTQQAWLDSPPSSRRQLQSPSVPVHGSTKRLKVARTSLLPQPLNCEG